VDGKKTFVIFYQQQMENSVTPLVYKSLTYTKSTTEDNFSRILLENN
jgi:hypothetical protein